MSNHSRPLRVAIVGSGPAGMYAAGHLLEGPGGTFVGGELQKIVDRKVEVDVLDRLPTPWGLIRSGVAPDHPDKKRMSMIYDSFARRNGFRFIGNVHVGRDLSPAELNEWYDAVIYAVGANDERRLGIAGEDLAGSHSARAFVSWYNGHPDFSDLNFDLSTERAVLVGNGNVAMDVARILFSPVSALKQTDIASYALDALAQSQIKEIVILGRRGAEHVAFNYPELIELGDLPDTKIVVEGADLSDLSAIQNYDTRLKLAGLAELCKEKSQGSRRIVFRFNVSPTALSGEDHVENIQLLERKNGVEVESTQAAGLVLAAIGYRGLAIEGLPFDEERGVIPNRESRIVDGDTVVPGNYVTGWIKRGPRGIIGTNKKCARDCVMALIEDASQGLLPVNQSLSASELSDKMLAKGSQSVSFEGWRSIDLGERQQGLKQGRPRVKFTAVDTMLRVASSA